MHLALCILTGCGVCALGESSFPKHRRGSLNQRRSTGSGATSKSARSSRAKDHTWLQLRHVTCSAKATLRKRRDTPSSRHVLGNCWAAIRKLAVEPCLLCEARVVLGTSDEGHILRHVLGHGSGQSIHKADDERPAAETVTTTCVSVVAAFIRRTKSWMASEVALEAERWRAPRLQLPCQPQAPHPGFAQERAGMP